MAVDQRGPHREPLRETDHRVVDGVVAVRVVLADDLADRPRALLVRAVGEDAGLVHRVEDAAVDRLQAVADVREGARGDDGHGVLDEALLHLGPKLADLELATVDVGLAGVGAARVGAEALLELLVVRVVLALGVVLDVDVLPVLALGAGEQAAEVVGHALVVLLVCHVWPFSSGGSIGQKGTVPF